MTTSSVCKICSFLPRPQDYVRAGNASESTSELMVSGSYDHTVKLWDRRKEGSVVTVTHGSPVDAVVFFPNDALMASAGGSNLLVFHFLRRVSSGLSSIQTQSH